jgi:hypothetical protein
MCGFCRITDLGILLFNFSSKQYSSKVYTYLEKVVVLATQSTTKLSLHFFDFSVILYRIYKLLLKHNKGEETFREWPPWNVSNDHRQALSLHQTPWNYLGLCNVVQGGKGRRGLPDSGEAGGGAGRGSGQDGGGVHLRSVGDRSWGGNVTGELSRRGWAAVAADGANADDARAEKDG